MANAIVMQSQMKMRNMLPKTRGKLILVINWQRTWLNYVCPLWMIECEQWNWIFSWGFPGGTSRVGSLRDKVPMQETYKLQVQSLGWEDPWRRKWQPTPVFLPGKFHRQRSLVGYSPWGRKRVRYNWAPTVKCLDLRKVLTNVLSLDKSHWEQSFSPLMSMENHRLLASSQILLNLHSKMVRDHCKWK